MENLKKRLFGKHNLYYYILVLVTLFVLGFNLFWELSKMPLYNWDEARHGVNAYEMLKNGNLIVNTYGYGNDYFNLKPPLSFWEVMLGFKTFGFNPWGLRFFSALAALFTMLLTALFARYVHGKKAALIAALVLATTTPYILSHGARAGDADALFVLLFTVSVLSAILSEKNIKWLYLAGLSFAFAFLAKSWHALPIAAIIGLYMIASGRLTKIHLKQWLIFFSCSFVPIIIWMFFRYSQDGYKFLAGMIEVDILQRTSSSMEGQYNGPLYYLKEMFSACGVWLFLLLSFIGYSYFKKSKDEAKFKNYYLAVWLWILVPFVLFTLSRTKFPWYIYPIFPPVAICIGDFFQKLLSKDKAQFLRISMMVILGLGLLFYQITIIKKISSYKPDNIQVALKEMKPIIKYRGADIYTICGVQGNPQEWEQSQLLAAELYGDFKPKIGGLQGFLESQREKSLLITLNNQDGEKLVQENMLKIVLKTDDVLILEK